jgi:hypothetical protein
MFQSEIIVNSEFVQIKHPSALGLEVGQQIQVCVAVGSLF